MHPIDIGLRVIVAIFYALEIHKAVKHDILTTNTRPKVALMGWQKWY